MATALPNQRAIHLNTVTMFAALKVPDR